MGDIFIDGFILREVAGEFNLLNLNHFDIPYSNPLKLNETGAFIFRQFACGKTMEQIAEIMSEKYEITTETALEDIKSFSSELKTFGVPLII